jgi:adenosylmethionine-8-amino-7-oxononanoate aminotransferase
MPPLCIDPGELRRLVEIVAAAISAAVEAPLAAAA